MSYNNTNPLYGGGGSTGPNYYDPTADFSPAVSAAKYQRRTEKNPSYNNPYNNNEEDDDSDPEDTSFFARAIGFISEHKDRLKGEEIDEGKAVDAHQTLYGSGSTSSEKTHDAEFLGSGAAMQALKMFLESKNEKDSNGKAAGDEGQNRLIGIAMAQAGKLWERDNKAGKAVLRFYIFLFFLVAGAANGVREPSADIVRSSRPPTSNPPSTRPQSTRCKCTSRATAAGRAGRADWAGLLGSCFPGLAGEAVGVEVERICWGWRRSFSSRQTVR